MAYRRTTSAPLDPSPPLVFDREPEPIHGTTIVLQQGDNHTVDEEQEEQQQQQQQEKDSSATSSLNAEQQQQHQGEKPRGRGCGRGIVRDARETLLTNWWSEMKNFNQKTIAVSFFLFFACIAPAITFGAVYGKATKNRIGAVEMLIATAWCGIVYALIGGQPMMINGGTGPVLAFTEILFKMSENMDVPFLSFNAWIGLWVCLYMCLAAFVSLNRIIEYATRFTDEIFALLIATIFIINALYNPFSPTGVFHYFDEDHKSHEDLIDDIDYSHTATALLSLLVCIGTVQAAFSLRRAKFLPFLPNQTLRNTVTDFAVVFSVLLWTVVAAVAFENVELETLNVPDTIAPTFACCTDECVSSWPEDCPDLLEEARRRDWIVDLSDLNGKSWVPFMAAGPAILAFILVFLDDDITWHLINHPAHKLTHGAAYDYDTVIIGVMIAVNGLLGLPILVAATVRSLNHVHALAEKDPSGKIESVQETRLTHLFIHVLVLISLFALEVLKLIPMPVLYGVFLFMGLVSLGSNTLWNRFLMFFMQPSKYPLEPYTMHVKPRRMHAFTGIQLGLFILLYAVKSIKVIALAFPIVIACCIPIRLYLLPRYFTEKELVMLDSDAVTIRKWLEANGEVEGTEGKEEGGDDDADKSPDKTHHLGEMEEFAVVQTLVEKLPVETGEEKEDQIDMEALDLVHPLPSGETLPRSARRKKGARKKSMSCPSPHLFFSEEDAFGGSPPSIGLAVVHEESEMARSDEEDAMAGMVPPTLRRRRPHRTKTLSCPTHLLFAEADRHVADNYFFG